jgi:hypothetical protein
MKLYWFRHLVQYFPSWDTPYMKCDATHILTSFFKYNIQLFLINLPLLFSFFVSLDVRFPYLWRHSSMTSKYVSRHISCMGCLMKFSYQTGYIMWHSRLMLYIPFGCASGNINPKPGMSHYTFFVSLDVRFPYLWRHSSMTSKYVSRHISCMGCLMKENTAAPQGI